MISFKTYQSNLHTIKKTKTFALKILVQASSEVTPGVRRSTRKKFTQPLCRWLGDEKIFK